MNNQNPKKPINWKNFIGNLGLIILALMIVIPMLFKLLDSASAADVAKLEEDEKAFAAQGSALAQNLSTYCSKEQEIASQKLALHYSGKSPLNPAEVDKLTNKAKGIGLECKNF